MGVGIQAHVGLVGEWDGDMLAVVESYGTPRHESLELPVGTQELRNVNAH